MAGITQAQAQTILDALIALSTNYSMNSEVEIQGRRVKFRTLDELFKAIDFWDNRVKQLEAQGSRTGRRIRGGTPI